MSSEKGNRSYCIVLAGGTVLILFLLEIMRHTLGTGPAHARHPHISTAEAALLVFCALLYLTERLQLFQLNLRLCFLSITLTLSYMIYLLHRGSWNTATLAGFTTSLLLLALLVFFVRYPLGAIRKKTPPLTY